MLAHISHFVHRRFIWLLIGSYVLAAALPGPGLAIRAVKFGPINLPILMLGCLLFNAGLGLEFTQLKLLGRKPWSLVLGLFANLALPIAYLWVVSQTMQLWHNPDEVQNILVGLALVASMPIAGSSTAWSQNANGNVALSLGLVFFSTVLSPLSTPLGLHAVGLMTTGDYSEDLHELAQSGTGWFLGVSVVIPSLLGMATRFALGSERTARIRPYTRLGNSIILLLLNYSNASISLPQAVRNPDLDFLVAILVITSLLCVLLFATGAGIAKLLHGDRGEKVALMFGLGMNNNGTGLVLASLSLADHPNALLPIVFYNLVQHLVAGVANVLVSEPSEATEAATRH